ncbi:MAG: hypothetical protein FJ095_20680 [Deltaproteobacteria bacterium]|nr:hypothetical protein [Deltaproteobacteria bacterium]
MKKPIQGMLAMAALIVTAAMMMGAAAPAPGASAVDARGSSSPDEAIPLDASQCGHRCFGCKNRCSSKSGRDRSDCEENCYDMSASCCEANGKKPVYKMCGCY